MKKSCHFDFQPIDSNSFEHLLNRCRIACEGYCHLKAFGWNVAHRCLDIVGNPFHKVGRILVLDVKHPGCWLWFVEKKTSEKDVKVKFGRKSSPSLGVTNHKKYLKPPPSICSSTSLVDIRPRKRAAAVKYRP